MRQCRPAIYQATPFERLIRYRGILPHPLKQQGVRMKKYIWLLLAVLILVSAAFAQTRNPRYEVTFFGAPPPGQDVWSLPRAVAVDGKGTVIVFRAFQPPVLVYNRAGQLQKTWGDGIFTDAHSIDFDKDGFLWITDRRNQQAYKYSADGKELLALGKKGVTGDNSSTDAFNAPADIAIGANGDIFVADGHVNSRVVHFSKDGKFIKIIGGTKGPGPGQFETPHGVAIDSKGRLLILDQQQTVKNARIQVFDQSGKFIEQWTNIGLQQPTGIAIAADDTVYVGDTDANAIFVIKEGKLIDKIGSLQARPHHIALDPATGVIYLADPVTLEDAGGLAVPKRRLDPVYQDPGNPIDGGLVKQIIRKK
jgi:DNA-binding beta-propeller fold protein YncE